MIIITPLEILGTMTLAFIVPANSVTVTSNPSPALDPEEGNEQGSRGRLPISRRRLRYMALIVSLVLFATVIWLIGPEEVAQATREADPRMVVVAAALHGLSLMVRIIKWRLLIKPLQTRTDVDDTGVEVEDGPGGNDGTNGNDGQYPEGLSLGRLGLIYLAGSFLDSTTPGARVGGEPLKAHYLSRFLKRPKSECLATVVMEKVTNLSVLGIIAMISLIFVLALVELKFKLWISLTLLLTLISVGYLLAFMVWLGHRRRRQSRMEMEIVNMGEGPEEREGTSQFQRPWLLRLLSHLWNWGPAHRRLKTRFPIPEALEEYVHERIDNFTSSIRLVGRRRDLVMANLVLAAIMWLVVFGRTYALFVGFDSDIYYSEVAVIVTISIMLSYLAFTPGGLGVTEVVLLTLYVAFGVEKSIAAAVAILDRFIYYGFGIGLGYCALRKLEKAEEFQRNETPNEVPPDLAG